MENNQLYSLDEFNNQVATYLEKLNALRKDGTEKVREAKYEINGIKANAKLDKETKAKLINKLNENVAAGKEVAAQNKNEIHEIVTEAVAYAKQAYKPYYTELKAQYASVKADAKKDYAESLTNIKNEFTESVQKAMDENADPVKQKQSIVILKEERKLKEYDAKKVMTDRITKAKDELHTAYEDLSKIISKLRDGKYNIVEDVQNRIEAFTYSFNWQKFLMKNGLYIIIIAFMIACVIYNPALISTKALLLILKNFSTKVFFALGVAGLILLAGTDLSVGRMVTMSTLITCLVLNPASEVKVFGFSLAGIYGACGLWGSLLIALLLSIILCVIFSALAGFFTAKFKIHPFISTLGTSLVIWGLVSFGTNNEKTGTITDEASAIGTTLLGGSIPITLIYAILAIIFVWFIWNKTKFGKNMYAVGGNPEAAEVSGISVFKVTMGVFIMAGILYGIGGFFQGTVSGSSASSFGQGWELEAIAACVIGGISFTGGIGKISGAVLGCLIFEILKFYLRDIFNGSADIANIFIGIIILVAVTFDSVKYLKKK